MRARLWSALLAVTLLAGCNGSSVAPSVDSAQDDAGVGAAKARSPIKHVVLIVQENRTFNDFFATFPGADGTTSGKAKPEAQCGINSEETIKLKESALLTKLNGKLQDLTHSYQGYVAARDGGAMDGFDAVTFGSGEAECTYPYQYTNPDDIKPYWDMAKQYALAEHMFTTQGSSSFTAHQDLIAGGTLVSPDESLVDLPDVRDRAASGAATRRPARTPR